MAELKLPIEDQVPDLEEKHSPQVHDVMPDEEARTVSRAETNAGASSH